MYFWAAGISGFFVAFDHRGLLTSADVYALKRFHRGVNLQRASGVIILSLILCCLRLCGDSARWASLLKSRVSLAVSLGPCQYHLHSRSARSKLTTLLRNGAQQCFSTILANTAMGTTCVCQTSSGSITFRGAGAEAQVCPAAHDISLSPLEPDFGTAGTGTRIMLRSAAFRQNPLPLAEIIDIFKRASAKMNALWKISKRSRCAAQLAES